MNSNDQISLNFCYSEFTASKIAVLSLLRCRKLKCIDREPPYGSEVEKEAANEQ